MLTLLDILAHVTSVIFWSPSAEARNQDLRY